MRLTSPRLASCQVWLLEAIGERDVRVVTRGDRGVVGSMSVWQVKGPGFDARQCLLFSGEVPTQTPEQS